MPPPATPYHDGVVKLEFVLHSDGRTSDVKVMENTMDDYYVSLCEQALSDSFPFKPWTEEIRKAIGADNRKINFSFFTTIKEFIASQTPSSIKAPQMRDSVGLAYPVINELFDETKLAGGHLTLAVRAAAAYWPRTFSDLR